MAAMNGRFRSVRTGNPEPIPILLLIRHLGSGGTERQLAATAVGLDRRRFAVHVMCFNPGFRYNELERVGIRVVAIPIRSFLSPVALHPTVQLAKYIREHRIQVVHTFDYPMNCLGVPVARMLRVPVVLSSQRAHRSLTPPRYRAFQRLTDRLVNGIVTNCQAMLEHLIHDEGVPRERIHLCYNGIDTTVFHPDGRERFGALCGAECVVGIVSMLRPEKDICTLLDAFAATAGGQSTVKLAIVGSGAEQEQLENRVRSLGIEAQCIFAPAAAEIAQWMRAIDIFVLPSVSEALSNSLMEAMACGCAVIASCVGGSPELIRDGETGLMFEPRNTAKLADLLRRLIADAELRRVFGANAAASIHGRFSLDRASARMTEIYTRLLIEAGCKMGAVR